MDDMIINNNFPNGRSFNCVECVCVSIEYTGRVYAFHIYFQRVLLSVGHRILAAHKHTQASTILYRLKFIIMYLLLYYTRLYPIIY